MDSAQALAYAVQAADAARARLSYEQAVRHLERSLDLVDASAPDALERRHTLLVALGRDRRRAGDLIGAQAALEEAIEVARRMGDPERMAEAAVVFGGVTLWNWRPYGTTDDRMVRLLEELLAETPATEAVRRAQLLGTLGVELYYGPRRPEGERYAAEAVALARATGTPSCWARR